MAAKRKPSEFHIYHVMNRGTGKQLIFEDDIDRKLFLKLLTESLGKRGVDNLCWCLMGNHFHLLLQGEMAGISFCMKEVCAKYARKFNMRHDRTGHLFQGVFLSEAINDETYLLAVVRYIHRNPVKAGISANCEYCWSSYLAYTRGWAPTEAVCNTSLILGLFESIDDFEAFHSKGEKDEKAEPNYSDSCALAVSDSILGLGKAGKLKELDKRARNAALAELKKAGLTIRQIQHITGIGRNIIQRAE